MNRRSFVRHASFALAGSMSAVKLSSPLRACVENGFSNPARERHGMIVATTAPVAINQGAEVIRRGGTAADAVVATAISQITLCAGCWVSFAGRLTAVYFDVKTGKTHALNACYDAPRKEDDPLTIPQQPTPSGRSVLVPGFMAGIEALHQRFGTTDFADLIQPSIRMCAEGFELTPSLAQLIKSKASVLLRTPEGRRVFAKKDGSLIQQGDIFRQPQLADTLRAVVTDGADHMYNGAWGQRLVEVVQREGGKLSQEDLSEYKPTWHQPLENKFQGGLSVFSLKSPNFGGPLSQCALRFFALAGLDQADHFSKSAASLREYLRIERALQFIYPPQRRSDLAAEFGLQKLELDQCIEPDVAEKIWKRFLDFEETTNLHRESPAPMHLDEHSDAIIVSDKFGNMAAMLHTINTAGWGTSGLFVDGVSIPDSGAFQQQAIQVAGPGGRISDHGCPMIAIRNGQPILGGSATGSGNIASSWQNFANVLFHGMSVQEAADQPNYFNQTFETGALSDPLLRECEEQNLSLRQKQRFGGNELGYWAGIRLDESSGRLDAGKIRRLDGISVEVD